MTTVFVTGAAGKSARHVVEGLAAAGVAVKAGMRDPRKAGSLVGRGVTPVAFDFGDAAGMRAAMTGADALYLAVPFDTDMEARSYAVITAATAAGITRVVKLSGAGAHLGEEGITLARIHARIEAALAQSGLQWTNLRPVNFMQNILDQAGRIAAEGVFVDSQGTARQAYIDARDIADAAVVALTRPGHAGKSYTLTGPAAYTSAEIAATLSQVLGRPVRHQAIASAEMRAGLAGYGLPPTVVDPLMELFDLGASGALDFVSPDLATVLGRPGRDYRRFAEDHRAAFTA